MAGQTADDTVVYVVAGGGPLLATQSLVTVFAVHVVLLRNCGSAVGSISHADADVYPHTPQSPFLPEYVILSTAIDSVALHDNAAGVVHVPCPVAA